MWIYQLGKSGSEQYSVESAHPTKHECEQEVRAYVPVLQKGGYSVTGGLPGSGAVIADKAGAIIKYSASPTPLTRAGRRGSERNR